MTNEEKEQLAIAQGLYRALGEMVGTRNPNNLRGRADAEIMADAANRKKSTIELYIGDTYMGCVSPTESRETTRFIVEDSAAAILDMFTDPAICEMPQDIVQKVVDWYCRKTGTLPDGCSTYTEPKHITGTKITGCEPEKVAAALGMTLPQAVVHLLGGEVE